MLNCQQELLQEEARYARQLVEERNLAQQQHADHIVAVMNNAQRVERERQREQNLEINQNNVAIHNRVLQENAAPEERRQQMQIRTVALEMRTASQQNYMPTITHILCVINDRYTVTEALSMGGDHRIPCGRCSRNDPDECFWIITNVHMVMLGRQVQTGRQLRNNQV